MRLPYLPLSVEEVSSVTQLDSWTNTKVRLVGRVTQLDINTGVGRLVAVGEDSEEMVRVSFTSLIDGDRDDKIVKLIQPGSVIQVLGNLEVHRKVVIVKCHIVRDFIGIDAEAYCRSVARIQPYLPRNVRSAADLK